MKFHTLNVCCAASFALLLSACGAEAQKSPDCLESISMELSREFFQNNQKIPRSIELAQAMMPGNELTPNPEGHDAQFYCNPLLLDGKPLDYTKFSLDRKGKLAVVEGDPESPNTTKIPFRVYLRREGAVLGQGENGPEVSEIEVSEILMFAQPDDYLIIAPVRSRDWKAKRIIKLIEMDGC